jgi:hypothetical protein
MNTGLRGDPERAAKEAMSVGCVSETLSKKQKTAVAYYLLLITGFFLQNRC